MSAGGVSGQRRRSAQETRGVMPELEAWERRCFCALPPISAFCFSASTGACFSRESLSKDFFRLEFRSTRCRRLAMWWTAGGREGLRKLPHRHPPGRIRLCGMERKNPELPGRAFLPMRCLFRFSREFCPARLSGGGTCCRSLKSPAIFPLTICGTGS